MTTRVVLGADAAFGAYVVQTLVARKIRTATSDAQAVVGGAFIGSAVLGLLGAIVSPAALLIAPLAVQHLRNQVWRTVAVISVGAVVGAVVAASFNASYGFDPPWRWLIPAATGLVSGIVGSVFLARWRPSAPMKPPVSLN